jgi:hypothetical protein
MSAARSRSGTSPFTRPTDEDKRGCLPRRRDGQHNLRAGLGNRSACCSCGPSDRCPLGQVGRCAKHRSMRGGRRGRSTDRRTCGSSLLCRRSSGRGDAAYRLVLVAGHPLLYSAVAWKRQPAQALALNPINRPTDSDGGETVMNDLVAATILLSLILLLGVTLGVLIDECVRSLRGGPGHRGGDRGSKSG